MSYIGSTALSNRSQRTFSLVAEPIAKYSFQAPTRPDFPGHAFCGSVV